MVTDDGIPALSSSTRVVVTVDDVNDNSPKFLERFYKFQIPSNLVSDSQENVLMQVQQKFHFSSIYLKKFEITWKRMLLYVDFTAAMDHFLK